MKIGIIGAGQIGGTLTRRLRALGHKVHVANSRDPRTLASLVTETGAVAVEAKDAPRGVDLVIITIPERNVPILPKGLFAGVPASVVVVDTGNYYPRQRDGRIVEIESGMPESRWVEQKLERPVIKAFNNIYALEFVRMMPDLRLVASSEFLPAFRIMAEPLSQFGTWRNLFHPFIDRGIGLLHSTGP